MCSISQLSHSLTDCLQWPGCLLWPPAASHWSPLPVLSSLTSGPRKYLHHTPHYNTLHYTAPHNTGTHGIYSKVLLVLSKRGEPCHHNVLGEKLVGVILCLFVYFCYYLATRQNKDFLQEYIVMHHSFQEIGKNIFVRNIWLMEWRRRDWAWKLLMMFN